jgi:short-subunit dehydrogenase
MVAFKVTDSLTNELGPGDEVRVTAVTPAPTDCASTLAQDEGETQPEKFESPPV